MTINDNEINFPPKVKIVIPIYKARLDPLETVSLNQLVKILKDYPKVIVKPENLDITPIQEQYKGHFTIQCFEERFFAGISGYNHLMLTPEFYKRFIDSKFILIYQLDAFVFRDELSYWCDLNYDYIGAPWLFKAKYNKIHLKLFLKTREIFYSLFKIKHRQQCFHKVGNGGLSLRNTNSCYQIAIQKQDIIARYLKNVSRSSQFNEDVFWALEATKDKTFRVPKWQEALHFSFDLLPELCYQLAKKQLPFGCHRWNKELRFWSEFIEIPK